MLNDFQIHTSVKWQPQKFETTEDNFLLAHSNLTVVIQDLRLLWKLLVQDVCITESPTAIPLLWKGLCLGA